MAPNLTACHQVTFTDAGAPVSCCPPTPDDETSAVDFQLPDLSSSPTRVRRPAHLVFHDDEYMARYQKAVAIMKALPMSHPHSFTRQAQVHCVYCTGAYDQIGSDNLFKVHGSWLFFPWHRAFLYFHERILGKLAGDDSFALPYWQWDHPDGMNFPGMYLRGSLDHPNREAAHVLPTVVTDVDYVVGVERGLPPEEQIDSNLAFMYTQMVSGARTPELFMGCRLSPGKEDTCDSPGTVEGAPHNTIHDWVGSGGNPEREDMGAFYSAARDPVFYAHHANVDRLWTVWRDLHLGGGSVEFDDDLWLDAVFYFHDENLVLNRVRVRDFLDVGRLGYRYEIAPLPWLRRPPSPVVHPELAKQVLKQRWSSDLPDTNRYPLVFNRSVTVPVARYRLPGVRHEDGEEMLVVYGIEVEEAAPARFSVYVNVADEEEVVAAGARAREFAGTFVGRRGGVRVERKGKEARTTELKLGISELLTELHAGEGDRIWVTLVPRGGMTVVVGGIRVEHQIPSHQSI